MIFPFEKESVGLFSDNISLVSTHIDGSHLEKLKMMSVELPGLNSRCVDKRRNEFYAGRWCAANAMFELTGMVGVPGVADNRAPKWREGYTGSISHTDNWALAAVASRDHYRSIGIDIEDTQLVPSSAEWSQQISTENELKLCQESVGSQALALVFSAKESLYKALNPLTNQFFGFEAARVESCCKQQVKLVLCQSLDDAFREGHCFTLQFVCQASYILTFLGIKAEH